MNAAIYVFGFVPREGLPEDLDIEGFEPGQTVLKENFSDISAIIAFVPVSEFVGEEAEQRLQDIEWVAPRAVKHQEAVKKIADLSPILPTQFGVLFSSRDSLAKFIETNHPEISEFLAVASDKVEWAVKVYWENSQTKKKLAETEFADRFKQLSTLSEGARYFKEKQLNAEITKRISEHIKTIIIYVSKELSEVSHSSKKRKIVIDDSTGEGQQLIANWAFLIDRSQFEKFALLVENFNSKLLGEGISFRISGPWPPYSFVPNLLWEYN
ncbi:MAG: GvpL/GvpF family gas vesicle protein [Desulfomonilaceae bacterium]